MTTITGFTSTRMLAIENNTVVSGSVTGDNLILIKHDGTTVDAGNVRGPVGPQGPEGEVTTENLNSAIEGVESNISDLSTTVSANTDAIAQNALAIADMSSDLIPAGVVSMTAMESIPVGWLELNGLIVTDAQTMYPELYAAAPASWKSNGDLVLPDMRGRMPVGRDATSSLFNTIGKKGGATSATLEKANVPKHTHEMPTHRHTMGTHKHTMGTHTHTIDHNHGAANTNTDGAHAHDTIENNYGADGSVAGWVNAPGWVQLNGLTTRGGLTYERGVTSKGSSHKHSFNMPNFTGTSGAADPGDTSTVDPGDTSTVDPGDTKDGTLSGLGSNAFDTVSPYFVLRFIIKAH